MRKLLILLALIPSVCVGAYNYLPSLDNGSFQLLSGGYYVWTANGITPTSDLVLEYLFGANGSESTITLDTSGNNYTGTVSGATWTQATNGFKAYYTGDGVDDIITSDYAELPASLTNGFTAMYWMWSDDQSIPSDEYHMSMWETTGDKRMWAIKHESTTSQMAFSTTANGAFATEDSWDVGLGFFPSKWTHFIVTFDGTNTAKFYRDMTSKATNTSQTAFIDTGSEFTLFGIGAGLEAGIKIADARIIGRVLSESELIATNQAQKVELGILSEYVSDNLYSNLVFDWEANSLDDEGSSNRFTMTTASAPVIEGTPTNAHARFNGSANVMNTVANIGITGASSRSVAFWAYPTVATAGTVVDGIVSWGQNASVGKSFVCGMKSQNWHLSGYGVDLVGGAVAFSNWTHVAYTYDGTTAKIYTNGVESASGAKSFNTTDSALEMGTSTKLAAFGSFYGGSVDQIGIWNRTLASNQVFNLYSAGRGN